MKQAKRYLSLFTVASLVALLLVVPVVLYALGTLIDMMTGANRCECGGKFIYWSTGKKICNKCGRKK